MAHMNPLRVPNPWGVEVVLQTGMEEVVVEVLRMGEDEGIGFSGP